MDIRTALARAKRGLRDDLRLHVVAVASLVVAFLCLDAALLSVTNVAAASSKRHQAKLDRRLKRFPRYAFNRGYSRLGRTNCRQPRSTAMAFG